MSSVSITTVITHDPDAILDYTLDWSAWLKAEEAIATSLWTITKGTALLAATATGGVPAVEHAGTFDDLSTTVWIRSATSGALRIRNRITTNLGRKDDRTVRLMVSER